MTSKTLVVYDKQSMGTAFIILKDYEQEDYLAKSLKWLLL